MGKELAQTQTVQKSTVQAISWNNPHSLCPELKCGPVYRGPKALKVLYTEPSTVDGSSQWELQLALWVTFWRTVRDPLLSLQALRLEKVPLESLTW